MPVSRKHEERALAAAEREFVDKSRHPAIQELPDSELAGLVKLVRERRDRARTIAERRRREMRGKAAPRGAAPAQAEEGSKLKQSVLASAMRRLNGEVDRRRSMKARIELIASANKALAEKHASEHGTPTFNTRNAHEGMRSIENKHVRSLIRPGERGRLRKAQAVSQAKKDGRG